MYRFNSRKILKKLGGDVINGLVKPGTARIRYFHKNLCAHEESKLQELQGPQDHLVNGTTYTRDDVTNVTERILSHLGRDLHNRPGHPLCMLKRRIVNQLNSKFKLFDNLSPIVTPYQNYDSLLVPLDHVSRQKSDAYYLNKGYLLRAHTSAHQHELMKSGFDHFLVVGDVYRRDEVDKTHYPVFHQMEAVSLMSAHDLLASVNAGPQPLEIFSRNDGDRNKNNEKQSSHTLDAAMIAGASLKSCLTGVIQNLFGKDVQMRWVDAYFPFTHPSWELEIYFQEKWVEILGCGIMEHDLLINSGVQDKIGWAFGMGLERIAMKLYGVPDIRLFWSTDSGFLSQFSTDDPNAKITYKPVSIYPQCSNDISFWILDGSPYAKNDFFDLVRSIGGNKVEQVSLIDEFYHKKKQRWSHCYRITYRDMEKTLTQEEVNDIHKEIEKAAASQLGVEIR